MYMNFMVDNFSISIYIAILKSDHDIAIKLYWKSPAQS